MDKPMTQAKRALLMTLENILGNECYNSNIQNYGPGGVRHSSGRSFRYPLTVWIDGEKKKVRSPASTSIPDDALLSGYYAFGANQLDVMKGLDEVVKYLQDHCALNIEGEGGKR